MKSPKTVSALEVSLIGLANSCLYKALSKLLEGVVTHENYCPAHPEKTRLLNVGESVRQIACVMCDEVYGEMLPEEGSEKVKSYIEFLCNHLFE